MDTTHDDLAVADLRTPVGRLTVAVSPVGLAAVRWGEVSEFTAPAGAATVVATDRTDPVVGQLAEYFQGRRRRFDLPLDWRSTTRGQRAVLQVLHDRVPYGESITYGALATLVDTGVPARAIGTMMGRNPLPIVVPCHRVLGHDGLGGYSGGSGANGLEVKRWLLTLEGVLPPTLDWIPDRLTPH